MVTKYCR